MAICYPSQLPYYITEDPKHGAEVRLYNQMRQQLGQEWVVFYSVAWVSRFVTDGRAHDGEIDFIVAHPRYGVLIIEVKGGVIAYDGDRSQWTTTDRSGQRHDIRPFDQAKKNKYALRDKVSELTGWKRQEILLGHAVIFPDCALDNATLLPLEVHRDFILDGMALNQLPQRLEQAMRYWGLKGSELSVTGTEELIKTLINVLALKTTIPNPLSLQIRDEDRHMLSLTAEQFRFLGILSRTRRAAISGCAGSGKTLLAVEKANNLAREGFRVLVTCFNVPLAEHLNAVTLTQRAKVGTGMFIVETFHSWCAYAAGVASITLPAQNGQPDWPRYPDVLLQALNECPTLKVDAIIVDEAQDFEETWWIALRESLKSDTDGVFYVFYDDNQRVRRNAVVIPPDLNLLPFPLVENVRNTRTIHQWLDHFYESPIASLSRGPSGRLVQMIECTSESAMRHELPRVLHRLIHVERVPPEEIVVLTPRHLTTSAVPGILSSLDQQRQVRHDTISRFKGLERSVVIVTELDHQFTQHPERDKLCYIAFSRPRNHLVLLGEPSVLRLIEPKSSS